VSVVEDKVTSYGQVALPIPDERERDRNFDLGGRSFYFFDFDDNIVHLNTKIILFHKITGVEHEVPTAEFPVISKLLSVKDSEWAAYAIREDDPYRGSFRNFREIPRDLLEKNQSQPLILDMLEVLQNPFSEWRGPSWSFFAKAVNNNRPISVITARGHHPHTIRRAVNLLVQSRELDAHPNYLSVYPVSYPETRRQLGDVDNSWNTAQLKKEAIKFAVRDAFACYGENPHHRFGMSDDDPHNVELILESMRELKVEYPDNAFYAFNTFGGKIVREEALTTGRNVTVGSSESEKEQLALF
jgi:hypothetical protein